MERKRGRKNKKNKKKKEDEHSLPSMWYTYTTCVRRTCSCNALTTMKARRNDNRLNAKRSEKGRNIYREREREKLERPFVRNIKRGYTLMYKNSLRYILKTILSRLFRNSFLMVHYS